MRPSVPWLATSLTLLWLVACGDDGGATDADAAVEADGGPGALSVSLAGPDIAYVGEEACFAASHSGGADAVHTWFWGDGERTEIVGDREACRTWPWPGSMVLSVSVEARGMRADASKRVNVVLRPSDPRPVASSTLAYDRARDRLWAVNEDADTVTVIDALELEVIAELDAGDRPRTVSVGGDRVAVASQGDATLRLFDAETTEALRAVPLPAGSEPYGVAADPRGGRFLVSLLASGRLVVVGADGTVGASVEVGPDPRGITVNAEGLVVLTRWRSREDGARVVTVDVTDPASPAVLGTTVLPPDVDVDSDTDNDGVLSFLDQAVFSPDGGRAVLPALKANVVAGSYRVDRELTSQTTARAVIGEVFVEGPGEPVSESYRFSFDDLGFASAAAFSPEGETVYVAFQGAERVLSLDPFGFVITGSISDVGHAPRGLVVSPDGRWLFVHAFLSRTVRVYDVAERTSDPELVTEIPTVAAEPLSPEMLAGKILFYRSADPRMSRTSYLSCASCHLDGEGDGLTWDFTQRGEGLRNTIPLRGRAGLGHGPLHWSANFDEVQDFEHDIRHGQGGTGFLSDDLFHVGTRDAPLGDPKAGLSEDLDALAAYVSSLGDWGTSPHRREGDAEWEAAFERGRLIFESDGSGCTTCHAGPAFTDSGFESPGIPRLHDVGTLGDGSGARLGGTLGGLDTPTLRGLWRSAPYLHDGSAATLREVLVDRNPADEHGTTSHLTDAQLDDLVTYLLALDDAV